MFFLFVVGFFTGCSTTPKEFVKPQASQPGEYEFQAEVLDKKKGEEYFATVNILSDGRERLRLGVTTTMGLSVVTLVLNKDSVRYLLPSKRRFYKGKVNSQSLRPLFSAPLNPKWLFAVLDREFSTKEWDCESGGSNLQSCVNKTVDMKVKLSQSEGRNKYLIFNDSFKIDMVLTDFQPNEDFASQAFALKPPKKYKVYSLK